MKRGREEMMKITKQDLISCLHRYVNAGEPLTIKRYIRLMSHLEGMSIADIAKDEQVTRQAVNNSVKADLKLLEDWIHKTYGKENAIAIKDNKH